MYRVHVYLRRSSSTHLPAATTERTLILLLLLLRWIVLRIPIENIYDRAKIVRPDTKKKKKKTRQMGRVRGSKKKRHVVKQKIVYIIFIDGRSRAESRLSACTINYTQRYRRLRFINYNYF